MSLRLSLLVAGLWSLALTAPVNAADTRVLAPEIEQALQRERVPLQAVSVLVQEAGTGTTRLTLNAHKAVNPASLAKLLTTYAALDQLGPAFTWKTPVWLRRPACRTACSTATCTSRAAATPSSRSSGCGCWCSACARWASPRSAATSCSTRARSACPRPRLPSSTTSRCGRTTCAPQALLLNLDAVLYTFTPDAATRRGAVSAEPALAGVQVDATRAAGQRPVQRLARARSRPRPATPSACALAGSYPLACGERVWPLAYPDPQAVRGAPAVHAVARCRRRA